ncbi:MAG: hypothetical protein LBJ02_12430 [Bifidobacteriaceae bacterium]|jgi:cell division protein FtsW (lipid II flippase)|nr:hypothetical protein [Bifidobacteriaceae bacterium]
MNTGLFPVARTRPAVLVGAAAAVGALAAISLAGAQVPQRILLAVILGAGALVAAAVGRPFSFQMLGLTAVSAAAVGLQTRYHPEAAGSVTMRLLLSLVAFCVTAAAVRVWWRRLLADPCARLRIGTWLLAVAFVSRFVLVGFLAVFSSYPMDRLRTGFMPVPLVGSVQIGELTRILFVVGVACVASSTAVRTLLEIWTQVPRTAILFAAAYLTAGAALDTGPTALTAAAAGVAVWVAVRGRLSGGWRAGGGNWLRRGVLSAGLIGAGLVIARLAMTSSTISARVADWTAQDIESVNLQTRIGRICVGEGGVIGRGWGTASLGRWLFAAESDYAIAAIAGDLGILAAFGMVGATIVCLSQIQRGAGLDLDAPTRSVVHGLVVMAILWVGFACLGGIGALPVSGISPVFITLTGTTAVTSYMLVGVVIGCTQGETGVDVLPAAVTVTSVWVKTAVTALLVSALVLAILVPTRGALAAYRPSGRLLARDGSVIAVTGAAGLREYPAGTLYADLAGSIVVRDGSSVRLWSKYGLETSPLLTCGNRITWLDRILAVLHPPPCRPVDVVTNIDPLVQEAMQDLLASEALGGAAASAAYLDSATGAVLGLHSNTSEDPNELFIDPEALPEGPWPALPSWRQSTSPGSSLKPHVVSGVIDMGTDLSNLETTRLVLNAETGEGLVNAWNGPCPDGSLVTALAASCNTVVADAAIRTGAAPLGAYLRDHFGTDSNLPYDLSDSAARPELVTGLDALGEGSDAAVGPLARTSVGQEAARASPLSMANSYSALVWGLTRPGEAVPLATATAGTCENGEFRAVSPKVFGAAPSREAAVTVLKGMEGAVTQWWGTAARIERPAGHSLAVKTGTADIELGEGKTRTDRWVVAVLGERYVLAVRVIGPAPDAAALDVAGGILKAVADHNPAEPICPAPVS